ncbi:hypothetical protein [Synechococcus sp. PCC 7502]|uniref:hypothetical protein n=1 Tax=Synechococcus sp. PCC 7502 TaxID=1173263 RepID=UPI0003090768|nr:hypothetical protein [Synechococcus sp. PCC 7502]
MGDPDPKNIEQAKILSKDITPKINLSTASRSAIESGLRFLGIPDTTVITATNKIEEADRETWKDLSPIIKLKCGFTTQAKLEPLKKVFYVVPPVELVIPEPPKKVSIKKATRDQIFERLNYLHTYKIGGLGKIDPDQTTDSIFNAYKTKWTSLNPLLELDCGIDTNKLKELKKLDLLLVYLRR